jgi:hypothetical protein
MKIRGFQRDLTPMVVAIFVAINKAGDTQLIRKIK